MYQINYETPVHIHFIGIGGISMSGLAAVLLKRGFPVSGSDSKESPLTDWLTGMGATIHYPQSAANPDADPRRAARRADAELQDADRRIRNTRENDNDFHALPYPDGRRYGSDDLSRRHSSVDRGKRPDRPFRQFYHGSL